jgi:hypothetical protein
VTPRHGNGKEDADDDDDDKDDDGYSADLLLASKILAEEVPGLPHRPLWILCDIVSNEGMRSDHALDAKDRRGNHHLPSSPAF